MDRKTKKLINNARGMLPDISKIEIPDFDLMSMLGLKKKGPSVMSYVLGGIGVALVGAVAGVMIFSPRTRYRAMLTAKDAYGKAYHKAADLGIIKNGVSQRTGSEFAQTTGL